MQTVTGYSKQENIDTANFQLIKPDSIDGRARKLLHPSHKEVQSLQQFSDTYRCPYLKPRKRSQKKHENSGIQDNSNQRNNQQIRQKKVYGESGEVKHDKRSSPYLCSNRYAHQSPDGLPHSVSYSKQAINRPLDQ